MTLNDLVTFLLAFYGALLASVLGIREIQRDKRRINVILEYVSWVEQAQIVIINVGQRPITITEISMETNEKQNGKDKWLSVPRNAIFAEHFEEGPFPVTIEDGEHITLPIRLGMEFIRNDNFVKLTVYDIEGNEYKKFKTRLYDPKWGHYR